jgi:hypothetical protein
VLLATCLFFAFKNPGKLVSLDYFATLSGQPLALSWPFIVTEAKATAPRADVQLYVEQNQGVFESIGRRNVIIFRHMDLDGLKRAIDSRMFRTDVLPIANSINMEEARVLVSILRVLQASLWTHYNIPRAIDSGSGFSCLKDLPKDVRTTLVTSRDIIIV